MHRRGIAVCTYNRGPRLKNILKKILWTAPESCKIVVCDDGSTDETMDIVKGFKDIIYVRGPNLGVGANKNRALWALQDAHFISILEDDLCPTKRGWFEAYEDASQATGIHHFCRVQDKLVDETIPEFSVFMRGHNLTPIYGPSPRGDMTFLTAEVLRKVGGFNSQFVGAGYAHGEWSNRVWKSGLIPHPNKWVDFKEIADMFEQVGDTEGGRWMMNKRELKEQLKRNHAISKNLRKTDYIYHPLVLS